MVSVLTTLRRVLPPFTRFTVGQIVPVPPPVSLLVGAGDTPVPGRLISLNVVKAGIPAPTNVGRLNIKNVRNVENPRVGRWEEDLSSPQE